MSAINISSLDMDARGVGHMVNEDGSQGRLYLLRVHCQVSEFRSVHLRKNSFEVAELTELHVALSQRVKPKCEFWVCGGCSMQHLEPSAQVSVKQRVLEDNLKHIGKVRPDTILRPIQGPTWGYRFRARLSVRNVHKKGMVLVGFHEKKSRYVANMETCQILPRHVSDLLMPLRNLISSLSIVEQLPQIELAIGEGKTVMVLRIMAPLTEGDEVLLKEFVDRHKIYWWLQTKGPDSAEPYYPSDPELHYLLPEFGVKCCLSRPILLR
jgi:23S rRNA (uracil1939-C5)-methyltransferase